VIIKIERSGGLAGLRKTAEIDSKNLPASLVTSAKKLMNEREPPLQTKPKGADYYNYKISIQDGKQHKVIECTQLNIQDELRSLVNYIEKNTKKNQRNT
jgi:hypothetical protein